MAEPCEKGNNKYWFAEHQGLLFRQVQSQKQGQFRETNLLVIPINDRSSNGTCSEVGMWAKALLQKEKNPKPTVTRADFVSVRFCVCL